MISLSYFLAVYNTLWRDFSGNPVARILTSIVAGHRFNFCSGNSDPTCQINYNTLWNAKLLLKNGISYSEVNQIKFGRNLILKLL